jgi:VanZ family protein
MRRYVWFLPFLAGCTAIFFVSNMQRPPVPDALSFRFADKLLHAVAYGGLAGLALIGALGRGGWRGRNRGRAALVALLLASLYGVVDEVHQAYVPGRSSTVGDWVADTLGALVVVAAWWRANLWPRASEE